MNDQVTEPLSPPVVARILTGLPEILRGELTALPERVLTWRPAPGAWCAKEIVGHLSEAEQRSFAGRIRAVLAEDRPLLPPWDQDAVAAERNDAAADRDELLTEFVMLRSENVLFVLRLEEDALDRVGIHPAAGELPVRDLLAAWLAHDREHLRQLFAILPAYLRPGMGNARRFLPADLAG